MGLLCWPEPRASAPRFFPLWPTPEPIKVWVDTDAVHRRAPYQGRLPQVGLHTPWRRHIFGLLFEDRDDYPGLPRIPMFAQSAAKSSARIVLEVSGSLIPTLLDARAPSSSLVAEQHNGLPSGKMAAGIGTNFMTKRPLVGKRVRRINSGPSTPPPCPDLDRSADYRRTRPPRKSLPNVRNLFFPISNHGNALWVAEVSLRSTNFLERIDPYGRRTARL